MNQLTKRGASALLIGTTVLGALAVATPAFAREAESRGQGEFELRGALELKHRSPESAKPLPRPIIVGTVTAVQGNTLTVNSKMRRFGEGMNASTTMTATTTFTVDASGATIFKGGATTTVSAIIVGDHIAVQGTINGSTITATVIRTEGGKGDKPTPKQPVFQGSGEPVVAGNITAVSGTTITIKNANDITYTVDAGSAKLVKQGATTTIANLMVGDKVVVQGTVNGTSITASSVIDQGVRKNGDDKGGDNKGRKGFMRMMGGFFSHFFGFF
jgi:hypothetical protein